MFVHPQPASGPPDIASGLAEPAIPQGAEPESAIHGPIAGRYDLGERIARGGMGIVYRAHDRLLNRTVAVKVMRSRFMDRPDLLRRFLAEARINGKLQHPGVVPVYEVGTLDDTRPFIAMKLIEGLTLARSLRERPDPSFNLAHYLKAFETLCQTVAYAHRQGVIHRDLKPDNIMVGEFGEVQVMDWGLAKFLNPADAIASTPDGFEAVERSVYLSGDGSVPGVEYATEAVPIVAVGPDDPTTGGHTTAGEVFGTIPYMPPEQARGEIERVDRRSDVFALGSILCQILTGQPPYFGAPETLRDQARGGRLFGAYVLLDRCGADQALVLLAKHCLTVDPDSRPADAGVLATMVTQCLERLQDRTRQLEISRLAADVRINEAETRARLERKARRLARSLAVASVIVAALMASWIGYMTRHTVVAAPDETVRDDRNEFTLRQIEVALTDAAARQEEAKADPGGPPVRAAAARQALADCQRAEGLLAELSAPPADVRERLAALKGQIAETQRGINLVVDLIEWRHGLFDARGNIDREVASRRCREIFAAHGLDPREAAWEIQVHPVFRDSVIDWLAIAPGGLRTEIATVLANDAGGPSDWWVRAIASGDPDSLIQVADKPGEPPLPVVSFVLAVDRLIADKKLTDAERLLTRGIRHHPNDYVLNTRLGTLLRTRGNAADAVRYLTTARAARPTELTVNRELGLALADTNRAEEAIDLLQSVTRVDPKQVAIHARLGELYLAQHDPDAARTSFTTVVELEPANAVAHLGLARAELGRGDLDAAARAFESAASSPAHTAVANAELGKIHLQRWEASKAIARYRSAVAAEPTNPNHRLGLIQALRIGNDQPGAIKEAHAAAKAIPNTVAIHQAIGELLAVTGDPAGAIAAHREAVRCNPADADARQRLATILDQQKNWTAAASEYLAIADLRPKDLKAQLTLARAGEKANDLVGAAEAYRRALALEPADVVLRQQLGRILTRRGDETAIDELKSAVEAAPESGDLRADLGHTLARFGRFRLAAATLREAADQFLEDSPKHEAARAAARTATRMAALEDRLPQFLNGSVTVSTPASWAEVGEVCRRTKRYAAAARFFAEAAKDDPKYAGPAATCAALAGFGHGTDAADTSEEDRAEWRKSALAEFQKTPALVKNSALDGLRDAATLDGLSTNERAAWKAVWRVR